MTNAPTIFSLGEVQHIQVDGLEAIEYDQQHEADRSGSTRADSRAQAKAVLKKMLGSDEKFHTYMAAIDEHTIVSAYVSEDNLRARHRGGQAGGRPSGGLDPQAAEVAALLPVGAQAVALVQPAGISQWVQVLTAAAAEQKGRGDRVSRRRRRSAWR